VKYSSIRPAAVQITIGLLLLLSAGCQTERSALIPATGLLYGHARIISTVVSAGGTKYVVDQMYTPSESNLSGITAGPRGDIWFTGDALVGKSTIRSDMTEFLLSSYGNATSIAAGPDLNLWVTLYAGAIGRVSPGGRLTAFPLEHKYGDTPFAMTSGPDNALWFVAGASANYVVRIGLTGEMKGYRMAEGAKLQALTFGKDGDLWFTDWGDNKVGRMTARGTVVEFSVPTPNAGLSGICQGPDGKLWFLEENANKVGSVTSSGSFNEYDIPTTYSGALDIVAGPDGALWFTENSAGKIGRVTTSGKFRELTLTGSYPRPYDITVGSDKNVWFTESESYGIMGRVDLREVGDSDPVYSEISLSLHGHPELSVPKEFPLTITAKNLTNRVIEGNYPKPIHLTTSDSKNATPSKATITSSTEKVDVAFSGHYTDGTIGARANGGARINGASMLPSTAPDKKLPSPGYGITRGPKDSVWICLANGKIASYSKSGTLNVYRATNSFKEDGCSIVEGPDGNLWFTDSSNDRIGKMTPAGHLTFFQLGNQASPSSITVGSDGALWFTENILGKIGRMTTSGQLTSFKATQEPFDIVSGPDGDLWYETGNDEIYKMTTSGKYKRVRSVYELGGGIWVAFKNIWFYSASGFKLEEMSTAGAIVKTYIVPDNCLPFWLAGGPQDSIWYVDAANNCAARMTLSGKFRVVPTYSQKSNQQLVARITVGTNGYLWFTQSGERGLGWIDPGTI
jgi:streptogramin lyase